MSEARSVGRLSLRLKVNAATCREKPCCYDPAMQPEEMLRILKSACLKFKKTDAKLCERKIHERTLTARFAIYLQRRFGSEYFVDCEYNKMSLDGSNTDILKRLDDFPSKKNVYPDIIVHKRTKEVEDNLLIIEAKPAKSARSKRTREKEAKKVHAYMTSRGLRYQYGYYLVFATPIQIWEILKEGGEVVARH